MKTETERIVDFNSDRNWNEDFSHENGNYENECSICHKNFLGHKRRFICKKCFNEVNIELDDNEKDIIIFDK